MSVTTPQSGQPARRTRHKGAKKPGGESHYARKKKYLHRHGGWGFEYPEPKPWNTKK